MNPPPSLGGAEERFRLLVGNVRDNAVFFTDPQRRVVSWNAGPSASWAGPRAR